MGKVVSGLLGGKEKTKTTKTSSAPTPFGPVEPALEDYIAALQARMGTDTALSGSELVAGLAPAELQALQLLQAGIGQGQEFQGDIFGTARYLADPARLNVAEDPQLQAIAEAITRPFIEQLSQDVLPSIRNDFVGAGQGANTPREREFQTRAMERTSRAASEAVSPLFEKARQSNLDAMTSTILNAPALAGMPLTGYEELLQGGGLTRGIQQEQLNAPRNLLQEYGNILLQFPFGSKGTNQVPYRSGGLLGGAGGAILGGKAASALGFGKTGGTAGSILGGLIGFSDDKVKRDVEKVGETKDGLDIIEFRYKWDKERYRSFRAQQVQDKYPEAVVLLPTPAGHLALAINYGKLEELRYGN